MSNPHLAGIDSRLTTLEARIAKLENAWPAQVPAATDATGKIADGDSLLAVSVTDGRGRNYVQQTTLLTIVADEDDDGIARLAAAAASPLRVRILKLLVTGERGARDISEAVGLDGGPLYHHLRTLTAAGLVLQPERSRYRLTDAGLRHLLYLGSLHRAMRYESSAPAGTSEGSHD